MPDCIEIEKTCAFTGNRELPAGYTDAELKKAVISLIEEGYNTFLCGMAIGFDMLAGKCIVKLKKKYPAIKLIACVPCREQDRYFGTDAKKEYKKLLNKCDEVKLVIDAGYFMGCMQIRDRFLVDNSSVIIGYNRKGTGGTKYTLNYAVSKSRKIILL